MDVKPIIIIASLVLILLVLMVARTIGYKKQREEETRYRARIAVGDEIVLSSGIHGKVISLDRTDATVEIAEGVNIVVERYALIMLKKDLDAKVMET